MNSFVLRCVSRLVVTSPLIIAISLLFGQCLCSGYVLWCSGEPLPQWLVVGCSRVWFADCCPSMYPAFKLIIELTVECFVAIGGVLRLRHLMGSLLVACTCESLTSVQIKRFSTTVVIRCCVLVFSLSVQSLWGTVCSLTGYFLRWRRSFASLS